MPALLDTLPPPAAADYAAFVAEKSQFGTACGFEPISLPDRLMPFQRDLTEWAIRRGRGALLESCGLGKTFQELVWADNVVRKTNRPVLLTTPLAVGPQTVREAEKFGVDGVRLCRAGGAVSRAEVVVTNNQRLHLFDPNDFAGMVVDESGCLKDEKSETKAAVTEFMRRMPYRLLASATPAPNDFPELGNSAEALGELGYMDMLARFFKHDQGSSHPNTHGRFHTRGGNGIHSGKWRFRGHAEPEFWRWVCSWARACRRPSDLGYDDGPFVLPPLDVRQHVVECRTAPEGFLPGFIPPAVGLSAERAERRRTLQERCEAAAAIANAEPGPVVCWVSLNPEGDLLTKLVPGAVQVSGDDDDDAKEEAFAAFAAGSVRVLVTKPVIGGWGLNWQHCARQTFFPSHSFEQFYQAVRRSWRFGQTRPVVVDVVTSEGEANVLANLNRKADAAERMFDRLVALMHDGLSVARDREFPIKTEVPPWLAAS